MAQAISLFLLGGFEIFGIKNNVSYVGPIFFLNPKGINESLLLGTLLLLVPPDSSYK